jgi:hypothetical protein
MAMLKYMVDGKRVPSVTTILSRFKESGGLVHWAWDLGMNNIDYRQVRDSAADSGTIAHQMVEADIRGTAGPQKNGIEPAVWDKALTAFGAYLEWKEQSQLKPSHTEVPLVCRCNRFGGCLDAILVQGKLSLGDWKTSNGVYVDHLGQLAAYGHLWAVNFPDQPIEGGFHLIRFSKAEGDFHHHHWQNLDIAWRQFELFREAYDIDKQLKERL